MVAAVPPRKPLLRPWMLAVALGAAQMAAAGEQAWLDEEPEFLPVDEAFALSTETADDGALLAYWDMPDGYYLYRHRFDFTLKDLEAAVLGPAELPPGKDKVDEYFGAVEVYYHRVQARVPIRDAQGPVEVGISYQGCAEAGLCYPPERRWVVVDAAFAPPAAPAAALAPTSGVPATEEQRLAAALAERGLLLAMALFFIGGIGLAFTPCVLPMVPILSSIIVGDAQTPTRWRAFSLSLAYVLGMAFTYAAVGTLMGLFGASLNLQAALQSPPVLIVFAGLFALLSLAMFGFYELRLPQRWQNALDGLGGLVGGGKHLGVLIMGALSALVVSPCVSAPLAGALIYISASQDAVLGAAALLALGLGMGVPLLIIGSSGGHLLPRAGAWMNAVKAVFGVGLLAVAIWLLERVVPGPVSLALWAALLIGSGAYLGGLDAAAKAGWGNLRKAAGFAAAIYGALLLIGAASGANDPLRPLQHFTAVPSAEDGGELQWRPVGSLEDVRAGIDAGAGAGRLTLLDLYADWCISCKIMERSVFPAPAVANRLAEFHLLRADVTANDAQDKELLNAFGLFGPPSLVFFDRNGRELKTLRVQGEIGAKALAEHLETVLQSRDGESDLIQTSAKIGDLAGI
ncbi:MAG: protein-disulfide reductase DsbD [Gammaproteobacteria bacterium]|nr:protein-disulfide reductase DsbD [Gammaproteobacteria bacterium]